MHTLRRLALPPIPRTLVEWRAELLTAGVLAGGLVSMLLG